MCRHSVLLSIQTPSPRLCQSIHGGAAVRSCSFVNATKIRLPAAAFPVFVACLTRTTPCVERKRRATTEPVPGLCLVPAATLLRDSSSLSEIYTDTQCCVRSQPKNSSGFSYSLASADTTMHRVKRTRCWCWGVPEIIACGDLRNSMCSIVLEASHVCFNRIDTSGCVRHCASKGGG